MRRGGKSLFSWICSQKKYQSRPPAWDCLAEIMEITMIVWGGRQTLGRWRAAGKYRWRRQPEGQYSLLYNLSPAALNYLPATAVASCECLERKVIEELGGIEARRDISAIEDQTVCPLKFAFALQPTEVEKKKPKLPWRSTSDSISPTNSSGSSSYSAHSNFRQEVIPGISSLKSQIYPP